MRNLARLLLLMLIAVAAAHSALAESPQPGGPRLGADQYLRGDFVMERHLAGFEKPLTSRGHFVVAPASGLIWQTREPFAGTTILTPSGIDRLDAGGTRSHVASGDQFAAIARLIADMLAGDIAALKDGFSISTRQQEDGRWSALLTPANGNPVAAAVSQLEAEGGQFVSQVKVGRPGGDFDLITLENQSVAALPLPDEAAQLLGKGSN